MNEDTKRDRWTDVIVTSCFAIVALIVFLPQGFSQLPTAEAWWLANQAINGEYLDFQFQPRISMTLFWYLAMAVNADSFVHINVLYALLYFLRAWLLFFIVRRLWQGPIAVAFAAAAIFVYHPADTGYFWLCTVFIMLCLVAALGSVALLLIYWQGKSAWVLAPMFALQAFALWGYEGYTPALFVAPLLVFMLPAQPNRKALPVMALWSVLPVTWFLSLIFLTRTSRPYRIFEPDLLRAFDGVVFGYPWVFFQSWFSAMQTMKPSTLEFFLAAIAGIAVGFVAMRLARQNEHDPSRRAWLTLIITAFVLLFLSRIPFVVTFLAQRTDRTMFLSGASGALVTAGLCWVLSGYFRSYRAMVFSVTVGFLVSITTLHGAAVRDGYAEVGLHRGTLIARTLEAAPRFKSDTVILLAFESGEQYRVFALYPHILNSALWLVSGTRVKSSISPGADGVEPRFDPDAGTLEIFEMGSEWKSYPLQNLVVIRVTNGGESRVLDKIPPSLMGGNASPPSYQPYERIEKDSYHPRACTMLSGGAAPKFCPP